VPETSVRNYHYSLRNDPEERSSNLLHSGSLKSRSFFLNCLTLEDGIVCFETSAANYPSTLRKIPEKRLSHLPIGTEKANRGLKISGVRTVARNWYIPTTRFCTLTISVTCPVSTITLN